MTNAALYDTTDVLEADISVIEKLTDAIFSRLTSEDQAGWIHVERIEETFKLTLKCINDYGEMREQDFDSVLHLIQTLSKVTKGAKGQDWVRFDLFAEFFTEPEFWFGW